MEIWKDIIDYIGLYMISNYGNVKSLNYNNTRKEQILKPGKEKGGYLHVNLFKNGSAKKYKIHHLVLKTFVGLCPSGMEGCHGDGNPSNNFVENLRWDTHSNNQRDRKFHGTTNKPIWLDNTGSRHGMAKLKEKDIPKIRKLIKDGLSNIEIGKIFNVNRSTIRDIRLNKTWKCVE